MSGGNVGFRWQDSQSKRWKTTRLDAVEFIRRYLQHVLPRGFVKVRYYGLYAHRHRQTLERLRGMLSASDTQKITNRTKQADNARPDTNAPEPCTSNILLCPCCREPMRVIRKTPRGGSWPKAPPDRRQTHLLFHEYNHSINL
jgi:hypothetical protein